jgi:hypothetical protein
VTAGQVLITCDNGYTLYFNGVQVGTGGNWNSMQTCQVNLQSGKNVVAVKCTDAGGVAALLAEVRSGTTRAGTSASWKVSLTGPAGWETVAFDDSAWTSARDYGTYGVAPWYTNVSGCPSDTPARWIWSSNNDADNEIYVRFSFDNGGSSVVPPSITTQPASQTVTAGQTATFSVAASGTAPLSYQWQKNGVNISGATSASYTTPATTAADNGATFKVVVANSAGSAASSEATLTVTDAGGPTLWWKLDETDGTAAADASGNGNAGTLVNGPVSTAGKVGTALSFNGSNQYASLASVSGLAKGNAPHTVAAWIRVNALPSYRAWILQLGNEGSGSHHWLINSSGGTQFGVWSGNQAQPSLPVGQWKHVAITFDGATLKSYVDGTLAQSVAATFNLQGVPLTVAQAHNGENAFNGTVDDVRVYSRALSAAEVAALAK